MNDRTDRDDDRKMPARADGERDDDGDDAASVASSRSSSMSVKGRKLPTTPMNAPPTGSSSKRKQTSTSSSVARKKKAASSKKAKKKAKRENRELRPAPYFYYRDHSREVDADPLTPLATTLSVPNFVTKLHAILLCDSLSDVIGWMPHGRSWKILNEVRYISNIYRYSIDTSLQQTPISFTPPNVHILCSCYDTSPSLRRKYYQHTSSKVELQASIDKQTDGAFDVSVLCVCVYVLAIAS